MSILFKFTEESCWDRQDRFRQIRNSVVFRVVSIGKIEDIRVNSVFWADYGIYYDPEDQYLIDILKEICPGPDWNNFIFWKKPDHSAIEIIDPADDRVIARVVVNQGDPGRSASERFGWSGENIVDLNLWKIENERD